MFIVDGGFLLVVGCAGPAQAPLSPGSKAQNGNRHHRGIDDSSIRSYYTIKLHKLKNKDFQAAENVFSFVTLVSGRGGTE